MCLPLRLLMMILLLGMTHAAAQPDPPSDSDDVPPGYTLTFWDEFDEQGLNREQWEYRYTGEYLEGINAEESVTQPGDGFLYLTTRERESDGAILTSMIRSRRGINFQYGYFEARIRFETWQGHHGAFWLKSNNYLQAEHDPENAGAEIDIAEYFGSDRDDEFQHNIYWNPLTGADDHPQFRWSYERERGAELSDEFHTFALLWTPDEYIFYVDGEETWRTSEGVSHAESYLLLSLITSFDIDRLNTANLPDTMTVDYVRVYAPPS